jgi:HPt (histidine-containing phosphotransfer) domain-containing protein
MLENKPGVQMYIQLVEALKRVNNSKMLYGRMLQMFLDSKEVPALKAALQGEDWHRGAELAHAIKGVAGNLGFGPLFETSAELMTQMREGAPKQESVQAYEEALAGTRAAAEALLPEMK